MRKWIDKRLKELGETKSGLGRHLELPFARISEIISGKRDIKASEVIPISDFLRLSPLAILNLIENPHLKLELANQSPTTLQPSTLYIDPDIHWDAMLKIRQELVKQKKKNMNTEELSFAIVLGYEEKHRKINGLPPLRPEELAVLIKRPDREDVSQDSDDVFI